MWRGPEIRLGEEKRMNKLDRWAEKIRKLGMMTITRVVIRIDKVDRPSETGGRGCCRTKRA